MITPEEQVQQLSNTLDRMKLREANYCKQITQLNAKIVRLKKAFTKQWKHDQRLRKNLWDKVSHKLWEIAQNDLPPEV